MRRFLVGFLAVIGFFALLAAIGIAGLIYALVSSTAGGPAPPERIVLSLDLRDALPEQPPAGPFGITLGERTPTLHEVVEAIDRAGADDRVVGLVGQFGGDAFGLAAAQEVGDAVRRFRERGRFTLAYADSFGEFGPANAAYRLASEFEQVWLAPVGTIGLTGIRAEVPFAREGLASIGVNAEFFRRGPYKSFPESLTERDFTPAHREMVESLVDDLFGQLSGGIARNRGLDEAAVHRLIDSAPLLAEEALAGRLVDRLATRGELDALIEERFGDAAGMVETRDYLRLAPARPPAEARIAVIRANGIIALAEGGDAPLPGGEIMSAYTIARIIDEAVDDPGYAAIVLRIDSGGGSAVGSDVIGRAVRRAAERGRPLIVSMGGAAASGGYWIAADARTIVAQPATLTGSIGVFAGKLVTTGLWDRLGIAWDAVQRGENAAIWSNTVPYAPGAAARIDAFVDDIYARFVTHVARGRDMPREAVLAVAEGRVWTGAQARERGLVDRLGGMETALAAAREAAGLAPDAAIEQVVLPRPETPLDTLWRLVRGEPAAGGPADAAALRAALERAVPELRTLAPLLQPPGEHVLRMPVTGLAR